MPYYLFKATIANKDRRGKYPGYANKEVIRVESHADIDHIWKKYQKKFTEHFGYKMTGFSVVMLSKHDPRVVEFIKRTNKNPQDEWWTVIRGGRQTEDSGGERS